MTLAAGFTRIWAAVHSWQACFDEARSQTFIEYLVNGWIWHRDDVRLQGFPPPPNWQLILLHPGVSLEYADAPRDGERFQPAVHLEVLGFNRWGYREDGSMGSALGFSLGLLYADREETQDTRALLQVHYRNRYSLGLSYGDGDAGLVLSADLLELGSGMSSQWRDRFMAARGCSIEGRHIEWGRVCLVHLPLRAGVMAAIPVRIQLRDAGTD